ncbi:MAG: glycosyltransferase, partial [Alphaproteobacteria bacterium]|nr:glycosyltransferase [Alphaproteobacteria bacterium]
MQLSVVVPVYNGAKFLSRCLDTLQQQTFTDFQVIFVDDGSTDESSKILDLFAAQDNRVLVIHKKNAGVSAARNDGINHAMGTYIHFMDVDDVLDEHYYEYMLNNAKNADVVCSGFVSNSKYSADLVYKKSHVLTTLFGKLFWSQALLKSFVWRYLFKTEFIKKNNLRFDTNLISQEDAIFVLQSFVVANKL